jgi:phosphoglycerol transferase MdoB-like AlkP superfamily enzyme
MKIIKNFKRAAKERRSREPLRRDNHRLSWQLVTLLGLSLLLTLLLELLNRRSGIKLVTFVCQNPLMLALDWLLIVNTLAFSQLFHRRIAALTTVALAWLTMGVVNYVVISFRTQPFTIADVMLVKDMFSLITVYFTWYEIAFMFGGIALIVVLIVLFFVRAPKRERVPYMFTLVCLAVLTAITWGCMRLCVDTGLIASRFPTLKDAYQDYGFAYTFINTFADMGISKPDRYSADTVDDIISVIDSTTEPVKAENVVPNIIYVQLESFFDADTLSDDVKLSGDPTPYYHQLLEEWPSGALYVPVVGGGTANTEFEILTGMDLDFFGAGEYPYFTVLRETPCETVCYVLNRLGYTSTAVHDYMATFYGRNEVYSRLGFNVFESMEYMDDLDYGEIGWAKDERMIDSIEDAMNATAGRDFVFGITVSTHGKYPSDYLLKCAQDGIQVEDPGPYFNQIQLQNFVNLQKGMDDFMREFVAAMDGFDEPVICVFYGDHLPALDWDATSVKSGDLFETQYLIWNNYGAKFTAPSLQAYRLSANLLFQLGIEDGVIFRYHQQAPDFGESADYLSELEILEYDMLYGELEVFNGENPFMPTDLKMGIDDVAIGSAEYKYGRLLIRGDNFNEFSKIILDDTELTTAYIDKHTLVACVDGLSPDAQALCVAQISREGVELSRTAEFPASDVKR